MYRHILIVLILSITFLSSCKIADLRTSDIKKETYNNQSVEKARQILNKAVQVHGFDKISQYTTYEAVIVDHYKGMMGAMGNPWGVNKKKISLRFNVGTFDSQMEILEGKKKGFTAGLQSWDYYEKENGQINTNVKDDKAKIFNLAAFQYFYEFPERIAKAPFVTYMGTDKLDGKTVDKVFASWGTDSTKDYDQYIIWVDQKTGIIEATTFTVRESPLPGSSILTGSANFENFQEIGGVLVPYVLRATVGQPKENPKKYLHEARIQKFEWNNLDVSELRPLKGKKLMGGDKPSL